MNEISKPPPSRAITIVVTALFGLFGAIPAAIHSRKARELGHPGKPYWVAFGVTFAVATVLAVAAVVGLFVLVLHESGDADVANQANVGACFSSSTGGALSTADDVEPVDCAQEHDFEVLAVGTDEQSVCDTPYETYRDVWGPGYGSAAGDVLAGGKVVCVVSAPRSGSFVLGN